MSLCLLLTSQLAKADLCDNHLCVLPHTCEEARASCEQVLDLAVKAVDAQADTIAKMSQEVDALKLANEAARPAVEAYGAWYSSPWLWTAVGSIGGAYAHRELSK